MKNRRSFLKEVCPTVAFAFFGVSFLEACSSGDEDVETTNPNNGGGGGTGSGTGNTGTGFTVNGNTYTIDLTHSNFSNPTSNMGSGLSNVGGWMNGHSIGIPALFLRISSTEIQAYSNECTHQNKRDWWELIDNGSTFRCKHHGSTYATDNCNSGLKCYNPPPISENTLTVTIS